MSLKPWMSRRFLLALGAMGVLFALLIVASARLVVSENELNDDITEDMVWLSSQAQYESVRFVESLTRFSVGSAKRQDIQLRLDLMISRIAVLENGEPGHQMTDMGFADILTGILATLNATRYQLVYLQPTDRQQILQIREAALPIAQSMRDVANKALFAKREHEARVRDTRRHTVFEVIGALSAVMLAGVMLAIVLVRDHRNMVHAEAELERERQVSKLHRAFISVVSHQFRTPLAIIDASAQRMIRRGAQMSVHEIITRSEKIRHACLRLTRLMESTLNAARLEEGEISFTPRACNLAELLRSVRESQPEEDQNRIELDVASLPDWAEADTTLLEQAVQNLVSNALKYSPDGQLVVISGEREGDEVVITVSDSGVGVPADELGSLFQRFYRARTSQGIPGTGIGLSFVAQIMELHGGRASVASREGEGSQFSLRFPYRRPGTSKPTEPFAIPQATA